MKFFIFFQGIIQDLKRPEFKNEMYQFYMVSVPRPNSPQPPPFLFNRKTSLGSVHACFKKTTAFSSSPFKIASACMGITLISWLFADLSGSFAGHLC